MSDDDSTKGFSHLLANLDPQNLAATDREEILHRIDAKISELMIGSREKLFQVLYRLDVNEDRAEQILSGKILSAKKMSKSRAIAELILEREIKKFLSRQKP